MGVNETTFPRGQFTLEQVDFLNRNPHYSEWRGAIAQVFARLDPALDAEVARNGHARLVIVVAPAQLPADPDRMWLRLQNHGKRVAVQAPERIEDFLPLLLTGETQDRRAPAHRGIVRGRTKRRRLQLLGGRSRQRHFPAGPPKARRSSSTATMRSTAIGNG